MKPTFFVLAVSVAMLACGGLPTVTTSQSVESSATIGVVSFQDCPADMRRDCPGSGEIAASIFRQQLALAGYGVVPLERDVASSEVLDDVGAVSRAAEASCDYVLVGEVTDFRDIAPMTFRADSAGVSIRLLDVASGAAISRYVYSDETKSNFGTPEDVIEKIAEHFVESL